MPTFAFLSDDVHCSPRAHARSH